MRLFCAVASETPGQAFERRSEGTFVVECYDTKDIWELCPDDLQELTLVIAHTGCKCSDSILNIYTIPQ